MLEIYLEEQEGFDEEKQEFIKFPAVKIQLEHSLISISKWEAKWHKPFLKSSNDLSQEEIIDYIKCMTISPGNLDDRTYYLLTRDKVNQITDYIQNPMTATWFSESEDPKKTKQETITSELIYYWMVALQIPFECQKWHINRLLTLIRVCNEKNKEASPNKKKKASQRELMSRAEALNQQRKAKYNTKG
jgi:hypothetical protein